MTMREKLLTFFLWWAVIGMSLWVGGTLFNMTVIVPIWSESSPESVRQFFGETSFNQYINNFFGPAWMLIRFLPIVLALILAWKSKLHRRYLLITAVVFILGIVYTLSYIYSINDILMFQAGGDNAAEEINSMVNKWIIADRLRFVVMLIGYYYLLKTFRLPLNQTKKPFKAE